MANSKRGMVNIEWQLTTLMFRIRNTHAYSGPQSTGKKEPIKIDGEGELRRSAKGEQGMVNIEWRTGNKEHRMADDYSDVPNTQYPCLFGTSEYW